jgi:hypothetical protein
MSRLSPDHAWIKNAFDAGEPGLQEGSPFLNSRSAVLRVAHWLILVELEEAQFRVHLEDRPLPIGLGILIHLGEAVD